jgi:signal peptidase I
MTRQRMVAIGLALVALGVAGGLAARAAGVRPVRIVSSSMVPAVEPRDWIVIRDITAADVDDLERGDIVMFRFPPGSDHQLRAIKRVVAVGGDHVEVRARSLTVNDKTIAIAGAPGPQSARHRAVTVPQGSVFLLGDNPRVSIDSRVFGPVTAKDIVACQLFDAGSTGSIVLKALLAIALLAVLLFATRFGVRSRSR